MNDTLALQILQTAVSDHIFSRIAATSTSKEAWDALKEEYEGSPQVRLIKFQTLRREYENLKMYENEDIKVFTDKIVELANQLTYHELIGILKAHEARLAAREKSTSEGAFDSRVRHKNYGVTQDNSKHQGGKKWCGYCKKNNHTETECLKKQKKDDRGSHNASEAATTVMEDVWLVDS
ncbi:hypothetical protein BRARA_H00230 [Brassica rapa]|uniref:Uncharacterized protein n=1 Tax=Brassica campestris TaxID=3711 RepID=A0A397Y767_BRACM|nr:hypothetical protein BRARA_H00230 [Brassica rapa]